MTIIRKFRQGQNANAIFNQFTPFLSRRLAANRALFRIALCDGTGLAGKAVTDIFGYGENFLTDFRHQRTQFAFLLAQQNSGW